MKHWSLAELYAKNSKAIQDRYGINETDGKGTASKAESGQWEGMRRVVAGLSEKIIHTKLE